MNRSANLNNYIIHKRIAKTQVWQNYDGSNKKSSGTISEARGFEAFLPNTIFETHYTCSDDSCAVHQGSHTTPPQTHAAAVSRLQHSLKCARLSLSFAGNLPRVFWLKVRCSARDAGVGVHIKTGGAAASSRLHTGAMFLWTGRVGASRARLHPLPRAVTEKGKKSEDVKTPATLAV